MAQIAYTKLNIKPVLNEIETIGWDEGVNIEVKQYLPLEKKLEILSDIINLSTDNNGFYNSARIEYNRDLQLIYNYTNIKFTDKQKEDETKLYDSFYSTGLMAMILERIPEAEIKWFDRHLKVSIDKIYEYRNSVYGILDALKTDYSDLSLNVEDLREQLTDNENFGLLKEVVDKLV